MSPRMSATALTFRVFLQIFRYSDIAKNVSNCLDIQSLPSDIQIIHVLGFTSLTSHCLDVQSLPSDIQISPRMSATALTFRVYLLIFRSSMF
jgi:hypothetical protein